MRTLELSHPVLRILQEVVLRNLGIPGNIVEATRRAALEVGRDGAQAAGQVAGSGARASARAGSKITGGLIIGVGAAFIVFDAIDLGFTIRDLVKNKGSEAARVLREKADKIEKVC